MEDQKDLNLPKINFLAPEKIILAYSEEHQTVSLKLHKDSTEVFNRIYATPSFPFNNPNEFIELFSTMEDGSIGKSIGVIKSLHDLDKNKQQLIHQLIHNNRLVPKINAILLLIKEKDLYLWKVATDRGEYNFYTTRPRRSVYYVETNQNQLMITDIAENRYHIPDIQQLDTRSKKYLDKVV